MHYAELLQADALSLTPSFIFSLSPFLSVVSPNERVQQEGSLLHCGRQWTPQTRGLEHTSVSFRKELRFEMSESNNPQRFEALQTSSTIGGGRGCNILVPVLGGNGAKIAPTGDLFDQAPVQMR